MRIDSFLVKGLSAILLSAPLSAGMAAETTFQPLLRTISETMPAAAFTPEDNSLVLYKSRTCGCCADWAEHMETHGFSTTAKHPDNLTGFKLDQGIELRYQSCHTAESANGHLFEGHVPAKFVTQYLANPPENSIGLTVPGMPVGSPGMEVDDKFMPYQVLLLLENGSHKVYAEVDSYDDQF